MSYNMQPFRFVPDYTLNLFVAFLTRAVYNGYSDRRQLTEDDINDIKMEIFNNFRQCTGVTERTYQAVLDPDKWRAEANAVLLLCRQGRIGAQINGPLTPGTINSIMKAVGESMTDDPWRHRGNYDYIKSDKRP